MANEFVTISTSNATGFVSVNPDPATVLTNDGEFAAPNLYLPTIYGGQTISIDIGFNIVYPIMPEGNVSAPATTVTALYNFAAQGINVSYLGNIVRLTGTFSSTFNGEYYEFVLDDGTLEVLPPDTTEDFKALVRYEMPNSITQNNQYAFSVTGPGETGNVTLQANVGQWIVWKYQTAVNNIGTLKVRGP
jgi:hypothetical protein